MEQTEFQPKEEILKTSTDLTSPVYMSAPLSREIYDKVRSRIVDANWRTSSALSSFDVELGSFKEMALSLGDSEAYSKCIANIYKRDPAEGYSKIYEIIR